MVCSFKETTFCRVCQAKPKQWKCMTQESENLLRNRKNYEDAVLKNDPKETGIVNRCAFNAVEGFHIMDNVSFDIMHDFLHGVLNYVLRSVIFDFVFIKKLFTLQTLNNIIQNFHYPPHQAINKPPEFQFNAIKNKVTLKCSAAEMLTLVRFFGLMIGDLIKNRDDESWLLYKYASQILDILLTPHVDPANVSVLATLVKKMNSLYLRLFGDLKPKFHYLVHYARYLLINGPLVNYWTMRCESRHRKLKSAAVAISCNINLLISIATKQTLAMCNMLHGFICGAENIDQSSCQKKGRNVLDKIEINNSIYCKGVVVVIDNCSIEKIFGQIQEIYKENDSIIFVMKKYEQLVFDDHLHAYILSAITPDVPLIKHFNELPKLPPCFSGKIGDLQYAIPHFKL